MTPSEQAAAFERVADELDRDVCDLQAKAVGYQQRAAHLREYAARLREKTPPPVRPNMTQYGEGW